MSSGGESCRPARLYLAALLTSQLLTSLQRRQGGTLQHHCRGAVVLQLGEGALQPRPFCPHLPRPLQWCGWDFSLFRPALHLGPALFLLLPHPLVLRPLLRPLLHCSPAPVWLRCCGRGTAAWELRPALPSFPTSAAGAGGARGGRQPSSDRSFPEWLPAGRRSAVRWLPGYINSRSPNKTFLAFLEQKHFVLCINWEERCFMT